MNKTEEFINKAIKIHGDKYDYSKVDYINTQTKAQIICKIHGEFEQQPNNHLMGKGCKKCAGHLVENTNDFIKKAKEIHGDKYDYSQVIYKKTNEYIKIICLIHGEFEQLPCVHIRGNGCKECGKRIISSKLKNTNDNFIKKAQEVHGNKYDYSKVIYNKNNINIIIICKEHGEFEQQPRNHLMGKGCSKCAGNYKYQHNDFIIKAQEIHGDKYDYSKSLYNGMYNNIIIICKKHGEFTQLPTTHINKGCGCIECGKEKISDMFKSNSDEFISKAKEIHGNKYDYSKVNYNFSNEIVTIICKEHGDFNIIPNSHLRGSGCFECGKLKAGLSKRKITDEFIKQSIDIHGNKYDYSKTIYITNKEDVIIICKKHGEFTQNPFTHLNGSGCNKCGYDETSNKLKFTNAIFIQKANSIHNNKYDYSKTNYIDCETKIVIICSIHGDFEQSPHKHLYGDGCSLCGIESGKQKRMYDNEIFINKANIIHNNKYNYSKVEYNGIYIDVTIICNIHGEFNKKPAYHLHGSGCGKCQMKKNYSKGQIEWLNFFSSYYNINIQHAENDGEFLIPTTKYRADGYCHKINTIFEYHGIFWHGCPKFYNSEQVNKITNCTFGKLYEKTLEKELKIYELGYKLIVIWDYEWNNVKKSIRILQQKFKNKLK
jgi:hypothetical protein